MNRPPTPIDPKLLERIQGAIDDIRAGKMVILVDDEDRENEGDFCMAAELVTPEAVNFMATHGRGLICLTLSESQVDRLQLPLMVAPRRGGPPLGTAFTVSVEARTGVSTGISAADRAHTMRVAAGPLCLPDDLVTPGHVFPLRARDGGVLVRTGQTEGSVDLARLAGLEPAGVICEIMRDDGTMARMPDLEKVAQQHGLRIVAVADIIEYRLITERLVTRLTDGPVELDGTSPGWRAAVYANAIDGRQFLALYKGDTTSPDPILCRVHGGSTFADLFASTPKDGGHNLRATVAAIEAEGRGIILYVPSRSTMKQELESYWIATSRTTAPGGDGPIRELGLGCQVLHDLGARRLKLLTNNPIKMAGLHGFGLEVVDRLPLAPPSA